MRKIHQTLRMLIGSLCVVAASQFSHAHDLGIHNRVWAIQEVNIKEVMAQQIAAMDWDEIFGMMEAQSKNYTRDLPPNDIAQARETGTKYVDASFALDQDIVVEGEIVYEAGTWVNPLAHARPVTAMLLFDATDDDQLAFALAAHEVMPNNLKLVMTKGDPGKLGRQLNHPVFYAFAHIVDYFDITHVPALLSLGKDDYKDYFAISQFAEPYNLKTLEKCWNGCPEGTL